MMDPRMEISSSENTTKTCLICGLGLITNSDAKAALPLKELNVQSKTKIFGTISSLFQMKAYNSCYKHILSKAQVCDKCLIISRDIHSMINVIQRTEGRLLNLLTHLKCQWLNHAKRFDFLGMEADLSQDFKKMESMALPADLNWETTFTTDRLAQLLAKKMSSVTAAQQPKVRDTIPKYFAAKVASIEVLPPPSVCTFAPPVPPPPVQSSEPVSNLGGMSNIRSSGWNLPESSGRTIEENVASGADLPFPPHITCSTTSTSEAEPPGSNTKDIKSLTKRRKQLRVEYGLSDKPNKTRKKCSICGIIFPSSFRLENHIMIIHEGMKISDGDGYFCYAEGCGRIVNSKVQFDLHQSSQHNVEKKSYICQTCGTSVQNESTLTDHLRSMHDFYRDAFPYYCDTCDAAFTIESEYKEHLDLHAASVFPFQCVYCNESFEKDSFLRCHTLNSHRNQAKVFKCGECSKISASLNSYRKHVATHSDMLSTKCDQCDYRVFGTSSKLELQRHKESHLPKEQRTRYHCRMCDRSYYTQSLVRKHEKEEHESVIKVRHKCTQCEKHYKTKHLLKVHMDAVHNDKCVAVCPHCNKEFSHRSYLSQHLRGHCSAAKSISGM